MTKEKIQEFINENVNPALEMHGGSLTAHDFDVDGNFLVDANGTWGSLGHTGAHEAGKKLFLEINHKIDQDPNYNNFLANTFNSF